MLLYLTRGNQEPLIPIQYFNEPDIILGAYKQLDHMGTEPIRIAKVVCNVPNLYQYLSNINMSNGQTIQQLSVLEYFVDRMDENEAKVFAGALDSESINGLADIITVAKNLHLYELIPNVTNDTELGQYLAEHDLLNIAYPQETSQHWDLTAIGIAYYSDHGGAYTEDGYVLRKGELGARKDKVFCIQLQNENKQTAFLNLPANNAELQKVCSKLCIEDFSEATLVGFSSPIPHLEELIPTDCFSVTAANELAQSIQAMLQTNGDLLKYKAILEYECPKTFPEAAEYRNELDSYAIVETSNEEYARKALEEIGADQELLDTIDGYMDFEAFGKHQKAEDGIRNTRFGEIGQVSYDSQQMQNYQME